MGGRHVGDFISSHSWPECLLENKSHGKLSLTVTRPDYEDPVLHSRQLECMEAGKRQGEEVCVSQIYLPYLVGHKSSAVCISAASRQLLGSVASPHGLKWSYFTFFLFLNREQKSEPCCPLRYSFHLKNPRAGELSQ